MWAARVSVRCTLTLIVSTRTRERRERPATSKLYCRRRRQTGSSAARLFASPAHAPNWERTFVRRRTKAPLRRLQLGPPKWSTWPMYVRTACKTATHDEDR
jgi:hypothetical protein